MDNRSFDNLSRQAATGGNLSGPLALFGGPGMASLARQLKAESKKHGRKKHKRQQSAQACPPPVDRCGPEAASCTRIFNASCAGDAACVSKATTCCSFLSTCDAAGFFACLLV